MHTLARVVVRALHVQWDQERDMSDFIHSLLRLLQDSELGQTVRSAAYVYPVLESVHILGIGLLIGPALTFDIRLMGVTCPTSVVRFDC